ncbi:unnamed protein product [Lactuca saligna]|uniref:Uncharacterized protein n=1 Tax=Lactuca saligna TaxID=75948 RepID=A0AA35Y1Q1_LACSI|nr:unnamed protein product [Lactuca saligna]
MDALVKTTKKVMVLDTKLQQSEKRVHDLLSEKAAVRTCVTDVTNLLSDIIETRDLMISITVRKHLAERADINDNEDEEPDETELKRWKAHDAEINETQRIIKEAEEKEKAEREAHATLKSRMLLFPKWTLKNLA